MTTSGGALLIAAWTRADPGRLDWWSPAPLIGLTAIIVGIAMMAVTMTTWGRPARSRPLARSRSTSTQRPSMADQSMSAGTGAERDNWHVVASAASDRGATTGVRLTISRPEGDDGKLTKCRVERAGKRWTRTVWNNQLVSALPGRDAPSWTVEFPTGFTGDMTAMDLGIAPGTYTYSFEAAYGVLQNTQRTVARGIFEVRP